MECAGLNTRFLAAGQYDRLEETYHGFLSSLTFPIQILVRVRRAETRAYSARRRARLRGLPHALVGLEMADISFMEGLASAKGVLEHRTYVVVSTEPAHSLQGGTPLRALRGRARGDAERARSAAADALRELDRRCAAVSDGLGAAGVGARRLGNEELARLWHNALCPRLARLQPLATTHLAGAEFSVTTGQPGQLGQPDPSGH